MMTGTHQSRRTEYCPSLDHCLLHPPLCGLSPVRKLQVWDSYLYWGDPALHHFVVLAFVIGNAEVILKVKYYVAQALSYEASRDRRSVRRTVHVALRARKSPK